MKETARWTSQFVIPVDDWLQSWIFWLVVTIYQDPCWSNSHKLTYFTSSPLLSSPNNNKAHTINFQLLHHVKHLFFFFLDGFIDTVDTLNYACLTCTVWKRKLLASHGAHGAHGARWRRKEDQEGEEFSRIFASMCQVDEVAKRHVIGRQEERILQFILTLKSVTFSPTASTSPAHSNPRIRGVFGGLSITPCRTIRSGKLMPLQTNTRFIIRL